MSQEDPTRRKTSDPSTGSIAEHLDSATQPQSKFCARVEHGRRFEWDDRNEQWIGWSDTPDESVCVIPPRDPSGTTWVVDFIGQNFSEEITGEQAEQQAFALAAKRMR